MRSPRLLVGLVVALAASLTVGLAVASADDDSGQPETFVTRLEPGNNLVGWTTESTPVDTLFESVPQIEHVWVWDASWRRWRIASPHVPKRMWTLSSLSPGMGLRIRLGGDRSVDWKRPRRPAQGTVHLKPGWNLVGWLGRDNAAMSRLSRGIGKQLRGIGLQEAGQDSVQLHDPKEIATTMDDPMLQYGQAIWVSVGRNIIWPQPTGIMPEIVFAGELPTIHRLTIEEQIRTVVDFYWDRFGLEADFSRFRMFFPVSVEELILAMDAHLPENSFSKINLRDVTWQKSYAWATPEYTVIKASLWDDQARQYGGVPFGQSVAIHEYTHILQYQLNSGQSLTTGWIQEGMAWWVEDVMAEALGDLTWEQAQMQAQNRLPGHPPLPDLERSGSRPHALGVAAAHQLTADQNDLALFELYREINVQSFGQGYRWQSWPQFSKSFNSSFDVSLGSFFEDFENKRGSHGEGWHPHTHGPPFVTGRLEFQNGASSTEVMMVLAKKTSTGTSAGAIWVNDGDTFEFAEAKGQNILAIEFGEPPCRLYYSDSGMVADVDEADILEVTDAGLQDLKVVLRPELCAGSIVGRVVDGAGEPLAGMLIHDKWHAGNDLARTTAVTAYLGQEKTDAEGYFQVAMPAGAQRLLVVEPRKDCLVAIRPDGSVVAYQMFGGEPSPFTRAMGSRKSPVLVSIHDDVCVFLIQGSVAVNELDDGAVRWVVARKDGVTARAKLQPGGSFAIAVPESGRYRVSAEVDGCTFYYRSGGATSSYQQATSIRVSDTDVSGIRLLLARSLCDLRISGRLLNADGTPASGANLAASGMGVSGSATTGPDGSFAIRIADGHSYWLNIRIGSCLVFLGNRGPVRFTNNARQVAISGESVSGVEFRLPEDPATFCSRGEGAVSNSEANTGSTTRIGDSTEGTVVAGTRVAGRLLDHLGNGIANERVYARLASGEQADTLTLTDGTFELRIELAGQYRLDVWPGGCRHFYRSDGDIATGWRDATVIQVSDSDITGIEFRLSEDPSTFCD